MKRGMCDGEDDAGPSKYQSANAPEAATRSPPALAPVLKAATATAVGACWFVVAAAAASLPVLHPPQPTVQHVVAEPRRDDGGANSGAPTAGCTTGTDAGGSPDRGDEFVINWQRQPITVARPHALSPNAAAAVFYSGESAAPPTDLAAPDSNSGPSNMDGLRAQAPMPGEPDAGAALPWRRAAAVVYASALGAQNVAGGSESFPLPQRGLTSRYRGVSLKSGQKSNPWKSVITVNNQTMHLGNFQSEE
ncbi:hypothetical protein T492DRAFT_831973 [Pavlovales sp. CCMP2436]|nr:hypothetical protein T492DRAFT_831973 [Pavlovales sp. CCMP2436]